MNRINRWLLNRRWPWQRPVIIDAYVFGGWHKVAFPCDYLREPEVQRRYTLVQCRVFVSVAEAAELANAVDTLIREATRNQDWRERLRIWHLLNPGCRRLET